MPVLAPGTILQQLYLSERLAKLNPGHFIEVGVGHGHNSNLLLKQGWRGIGLDLNPQCVAVAKQTNQSYVTSSNYDVLNENFLQYQSEFRTDLIISCMVLEHLADEKVAAYFAKCKQLLNPNGCIILLVPSSPKHWGIEDDIAGHYRRYTQESITKALHQHAFTPVHMTGLTYPVSNCLLPISNFLVNRAEKNKLKMEISERTQLSGNREVAFKTTFPTFLKYVLNPITLYPLHILQKMFGKNANNLVIYTEASLT